MTNDLWPLVTPTTPSGALNTHGQTGTCPQHGSQLCGSKGHAGISPQATSKAIRERNGQRPESIPMTTREQALVEAFAVIVCNYLDSEALSREDEEAMIAELVKAALASSERSPQECICGPLGYRGHRPDCDR